MPIVWRPTGTQANLFYKGASGQIYNWYGSRDSPGRLAYGVEANAAMTAASWRGEAIIVRCLPGT